MVWQVINHYMSVICYFLILLFVLFVCKTTLAGCSHGFHSRDARYSDMPDDDIPSQEIP